MERIGKYQIKKVLGRGGMGTVYEAIDPLINRKVAVKTMIPGLADSADLRARFMREAQAAGGLQHRNIVTVYDLGEDKGQPYIAMEFIEGTDLEKVVQNREPLTLEWKLDVLRQVCEGLGYAHRNGIVHRDVKPANIRVTQTGEVKIMDFGIAHLQSSTMTKSGLVLGTVHYMSPEQIEGQKVDHRADIFSVGAIAYELIAYRKPFDGESLTAVMFRIMNERPDPKPLSETPYSPALEAIVMKALERDPANRYQSLDDMQSDFEAILRESHTLVPERPGTPRTGDDRQARAAQLVDTGQDLLAQGQPEAALEKAKEALLVAPTDAAVRELLRIAEGAVTARRVEAEIADLRGAMERARAEGQLQKALALCRRLMELSPADPSIAKFGSEIEIAIHDREVEQLCSLALAYAADGDTELALKIASKIERLSPRSPRYLKLKSFLDDEQKKQDAEAILASAREHLAEGNLVAAHGAAERALEILPGHALAKEIRDRTESVLMKAAGAAAVESAPATAPADPAPATQVEGARPAPPRPPAAPPAPGTPAPAPVAAPAPAPKTAATPTPPVPAPPPPASRPTAPPPPAEGQTVALPRPTPLPAPPKPAAAPAPAPPLAAAGSAPAAVTAAAPPARPAAPPPMPPPAPARPAPVAPAPAPAATLTPPPEGRSEADVKRAELERLTTIALNAFVENNHPKARKAAEKALALDPENKRARELMKILGALG